MIIELQQLKGESKLKQYKNLSNYYDKMNIKMDEDPFAQNAQDIGKIYHEVLMLIKFLQTKPQVKDMNINYYDLYYTVIDNRYEKENVIDKDNENDYNIFDDFITPKHYIGRKKNNEIIK